MPHEDYPKRRYSEQWCGMNHGIKRNAMLVRGAKSGEVGTAFLFSRGKLLQCNIIGKVQLHSMYGCGVRYQAR